MKIFEHSFLSQWLATVTVDSPIHIPKPAQSSVVLLQDYHRRLNQKQSLLDVSYGSIFAYALLNHFHRCRTEVSTDDPFQSDAIQCCHQSEELSWIEH